MQRNVLLLVTLALCCALVVAPPPPAAKKTAPDAKAGQNTKGTHLDVKQLAPVIAKKANNKDIGLLFQGATQKDVPVATALKGSEVAKNKANEAVGIAVHTVNSKEIAAAANEAPNLNFVVVDLGVSPTAAPGFVQALKEKLSGVLHNAVEDAKKVLQKGATAGKDVVLAAKDKLQNLKDKLLPRFKGTDKKPAANDKDAKSPPAGAAKSPAADAGAKPAGYDFSTLKNRNVFVFDASGATLLYPPEGMEEPKVDPKGAVPPPPPPSPLVAPPVTAPKQPTAPKKPAF